MSLETTSETQSCTTGDGEETDEGESEGESLSGHGVF